MQLSPFTAVLGRWWWGGGSWSGPKYYKREIFRERLNSNDVSLKRIKTPLETGAGGWTSSSFLDSIECLSATTLTAGKLNYFVLSLTTCFSFISCTFSHIPTVQQFRSYIYIFFFSYWPLLTESDVSYYCVLLRQIYAFLIKNFFLDYSPIILFSRSSNWPVDAVCRSRQN